MDKPKRTSKKKASKSKPLSEAQPSPAPKSRPERSKAALKEFMEIGGSPVPGITLRCILRGHSRPILRFNWAPHEHYLASPSVDKTVRIWDIERGNCLKALDGHKGDINSVAWSPDGHRLASGSHDQTIRIWDSNTWRNLAVLRGHEGGVSSVAWSPDGRRLAGGTWGHKVHIWDATTWECSDIFEWHNSQVNDLAWSSDGEWLASGSSKIVLWNPVAAKLQTLGHDSNTLAWIPGHLQLASAGYRRTIMLWNVPDGTLNQELEGHTNMVLRISFSVDGPLLASKGNEGAVHIWRTDTAETLAILPETISDKWPPGPAFHPRLPRLATLGENDTIIRIWDLDLDVLLVRQAVTESMRYTTAKVVLVGDSGVGKTGLGWRLAHGEFKEHPSTHGQQFWVIDELKARRRDGTECEAVLWDLAGQHVYRAVHAIFLDDVDLSLVLFDPTNRQEPLKGAEFWLEQLAGKGELPPSVLVGARG